MFQKLREKPFWVHILIIIAIVILFLFSFLQLLGIITKHGDYLTVPAVVNKSTAEAIKLLESKGFDVMIQDSVYTDTAKMGIVLQQFPEPNSTVKVNRIVLLTVNRVTLPMVDMPSLQNKSLNYAIEILKRSHLLLGDTSFRNDYAQGAVLEQRFNGNILESGAKLPWGSKVDLVVGAGLSDQEQAVPSLLGLTYGEAKSILEQQGILIGSVVGDPGITDTANAFIYKQIPPKLDDDKQQRFIRSGQVMDLWLSPVPKVLKDSTSTPSE